MKFKAQNTQYETFSLNDRYHVHCEYYDVFKEYARSSDGHWNQRTWDFDLSKREEIDQKLEDIFGSEFIDVKITISDILILEKLQIGERTIARRKTRDLPVTLDRASLVKGKFPDWSGSRSHPTLLHYHRGDDKQKFPIIITAQSVDPSAIPAFEEEFKDEPVTIDKIGPSEVMLDLDQLEVDTWIAALIDYDHKKQFKRTYLDSLPKERYISGDVFSHKSYHSFFIAGSGNSRQYIYLQLTKVGLEQITRDELERRFFAEIVSEVSRIYDLSLSSLNDQLKAFKSQLAELKQDFMHNYKELVKKTFKTRYHKDADSYNLISLTDDINLNCALLIFVFRDVLECSSQAGHRVLRYFEKQHPGFELQIPSD